MTRVYSFNAILFALFLCLGTVQVVAAEEFVVPQLTGPVVDQANFLSTDAQSKLDQFLRRHAERGGAQVQVAIVDSLAGLSIEEASIKIVDQWKLGEKKTDRGILLLVAPNERKVRIEVGQGLEGDLPDVVASRIIQEVITPYFKAGEKDRGVINGVMAIVRKTDPNLSEPTSDVPGEQGLLDAGDAKDLLLERMTKNWITILFWVIIFIVVVLRPRRRGIFGGGGFGGGGFGGGGFGGGSSGGGSWSGGGGGFSGGGSSGSW